MAEQYVITGQKQVQARDATDVYVPAVRVSFTVGPLGPFSVDVPVASYTPESVRALIADYVSHIVGVSALGK